MSHKVEYFRPLQMHSISDTYRALSKRLNQMHCEIYVDAAVDCMNTSLRHSDVIMGKMASQITSASVVCSTVCSDEDHRKHQSLCEGNSPVTGEFRAQRTRNAKNVSIWWGHHGSIVLLLGKYINCFGLLQFSPAEHFQLCLIDFWYTPGT